MRQLAIRRPAAHTAAAPIIIVLAVLALLPNQATAQTVNVGSASGLAGWTITVTVSLSTGGTTPAGTQNQIAFDATKIQIAATAAGTPDCTVNAATGKTGAFAFSPSGCTGAQCTKVRALIRNASNSPMSSGAIYTCKVKILPATPAGTYALTNSDVQVASAAPVVLGTSGASGTITVVP